MANSRKVRDSIKGFLEKMRAMDEAIPQELAEDALEMTEEVNDALNELETIDEGEEIVKEKEKSEEVESKVEDALVKVMRKYGLIEDGAMKNLDEIEEKIEEKLEDECGVDEVTVAPEKINDSAAEIRNFIRQIKPVIASVKDSKQRKALADSVANIAKISMNDQYSEIYNVTRKSSKDAMNNKVKAKDSDFDFGMEIAKKFNPHYKEV
uniref:Uncharacterized protein n=1 Tax=Siphoviridae sp. ctsIQ24 TaxID=2826484 RepID=A0A8S5MP85_9CAUD|nr:MAG TPA: hypothetical protein [Siphoviridae sp. ctsIQ24]